MQGLVGAAFEGFGVAVGALVGGVVFKNFGGRMLFLSAGIVSSVACVIHAVIQIVMNRVSQDSQTDNTHNLPENQKFI